MYSGAVVVDISSDDEPDGLSIDKQLEFNVSSFIVDREDSVDDILLSDNWLDDSSGNPGSLRLKKSEVVRDDSDDEDCLILDGDPDKPVAICNDGKGNGRVGVDASDDLLIVGQKGQVACRDFPHSRHLCANFSFDDTSHEKHCSLCHCFVCDSPAPCIYWGNGLSLTDHCHATDKNETWKSQRRAFQKISIPTLHPQRLHIPIGNTIQRPSVLITHQPVRFSIPPPTQASKTNRLRPCSITRSIPPRITNQPSIGFSNRVQNPSCTQLRPAILQPQREKRVDSVLSSPNMQSQPQFKRVATTGSKVIGNTAPYHLVSSQRQILESNWRRTQPQPAASVRSQQMPAASPGYQFPLVTQQRHPRAQVTAQMPHSTAVAEDDGARRWRDILKGVASELGVAECMSESVTAAQPYTAASHQPSSDHMNSSQGTGLMTIASNYSDFDSRWLNPIPEQFQGGASQLAANNNVVSGDINLDSFLASIESENTVSVPGKESGFLGEDPTSSLFDFDGSWSSMANA